MSKAILVMDMPDSCFHCDCCHEKPYDNRYRIEGDKFCGIEDMEVDNYYNSSYSEEPMRPNWCPLKELPEKSHTGKSDYYQLEDWEGGWNACIDELLNK